jgi:hypothetical protein
MAIGSKENPLTLGELDGLGAATSAVAGSLDISALSAQVVHVSVSAAAYIGCSSAAGTIDNAKGMVVTPESGGVFLRAGKYIHHVRVSADGRLCVVKVL